MKQLIDRIFWKIKRCSLGTLHLISQRGDPVTVTKEICYTVHNNGSKVHLNSYGDLAHYCRHAGITHPNGRPV